MKFACFDCFSSNIKNVKDSSDFEYDKNEPSEYVVEKLVIKRIPIRLFQAKKDVSADSIASAKSTAKANPSPLLPDKKTNVTFESYYSMVPKSDAKSISHGSTPTREESVITLESEESEHKPLVPIQAKNVASEEAERELVSKVLNTYSSLYTLDAKQAIPKDPCPINMPKHMPTSPVYIPEHLRNQIPVHRFTKVLTFYSVIIVFSNNHCY